MWATVIVGLRIVHLTAGHLRLSVEALPPDHQQSLVRRARSLSGVRSATHTSLTGNMLVRFDPAITDAACLMDALCALPSPAPCQASREGVTVTRGSVAVYDHAERPAARSSGAVMLPPGLIKIARIIATVGRLPGVPWLLRLVVGPMLAEALVGAADLVSLLAEHGARPACRACEQAPRHGPDEAWHRARAPSLLGAGKTRPPRRLLAPQACAGNER